MALNTLFSMLVNSIDDFARRYVWDMMAGQLGEVRPAMAGMLFLTWLFLGGLNCAGPRIFAFVSGALMMDFQETSSLETYKLFHIIF